MEKNKKVSIVIPTFNRANYLRTAIESALSQSYKCEIVICDHGSTDNTQQLVKSYGDSVKYIRREVDNGIHFMWLDGIINASGEYIHLNFDDDWIAPTFVEELLELFYDDVGFVISAVRIIKSNNNEKIEYLNLFKNGINKKALLEKYLLRPGTILSPGCGIHRKIDLIDILLVGNIPGSKIHYKGVGPDLLFSLMPFMRYDKFGFVNKPLAFLRSHENSITSDSNNEISKSKKFENAYDEAKIFYLKIKLFKIFNLDRIVFCSYNYFIIIPYRIKIKILKLLGLY